MPRSLTLSLADSMSFDVIARIIGGTRSADDGAPQVREIVVPAQGTIDVPLEPGVYSIQLLLPSGGVFISSFRIGEEGLALPIKVPEAASTITSLDAAAPDADVAATAALQATSDRVRATSPLKRLRRRTRQMFGRAGRPPQRPSREMANQRPSPRQRLNLLGWPHAEETSEWDLLAVPPSQWSYTTMLRSGVQRIDPTADADGATSFATDAEIGRAWIWAATTSAEEVASLPRLRARDGSSNPLAEVLVDVGDGTEALLSVTAPASANWALFAYFEAARLSVLTTLVDALEQDGSIEAAVAGPKADPLAVCVAAYVRLATSPGPLSREWICRLQMLAEENPDIPDCLLVNARALMGDSSNARDVTTREQLKQVFAAGIPYFSAGLQLLREMLMVSEINAEDGQPLRTKVEAVASRCDFTRYVTTLRYSGG
jgi:hypothetical protein